MTLSEYFSLPESLSIARLREAIGAKSDAQVRQWQHGYAKRKPGPAYCVAIERVTGGLVTRKDLRPSDWHLYWPELESGSKPSIVANATTAGVESVDLAHEVSPCR